LLLDVEPIEEAGFEIDDDEYNMKPK